ncbi:Na+ dependent nucleoside transporter N-terminal domain-containing protein [Leptolyngbya sp. 7M]|uniref:Na+ dependent nucleoside transporter N-terminal domain-containing protein n=1 Tax=Leptolyngbya sp. 7M TaxID=2812896 RepID=UPI001B8C0CE2|nr:Na+ dependent nucleoside transporter N-terminal domain-containing protein [Leptolyngbya sp. 7M]QYO63073.1 hypothetical protein JVX88_24320 [Leptolyngbya sp. 7M]
MERFISLIGIFVFFGLAYLLSVDRRAIRWRPVIWGFAIQFLFGLFVLLLPVGFAIFSTIGNLVTPFPNFSDVGAEFVYGENSSIGQQIGAIGGIVPSRRNDVARLGPRAMIAGSLTNFVSACIAGLLLGSKL